MIHGPINIKLQLVCSSQPHPIQIHMCERRDIPFIMSHNLGSALESFLRSSSKLIPELSGSTRQNLSYPPSQSGSNRRHKVCTWHGICYIQNEQYVFWSANQSPTCVSPCAHQIQRNRGTSWGRNHIQLATSGSIHALRTASPHWQSRTHYYQPCYPAVPAHLVCNYTTYRGKKLKVNQSH